MRRRPGGRRLHSTMAAEAALSFPRWPLTLRPQKRGTNHGPREERQARGEEEAPPEQEGEEGGQGRQARPVSAAAAALAAADQPMDPAATAADGRTTAVRRGRSFPGRRRPNSASRGPC